MIIALQTCAIHPTTCPRPALNQHFVGAVSDRDFGSPSPSETPPTPASPTGLPARSAAGTDSSKKPLVFAAAATASIALDTARQVEIIRPDRRIASGSRCARLQRHSRIAVHHLGFASTRVRIEANPAKCLASLLPSRARPLRRRLLAAPARQHAHHRRRHRQHERHGHGRHESPTSANS